MKAQIHANLTYLCLPCTRETQEEVKVALPDFTLTTAGATIHCPRCKQSATLRPRMIGTASSPAGDPARGYFDSPHPLGEPIEMAKEVFLLEGDLELIEEFSLPVDLKKILREKREKRQSSRLVELRKLKALEEYQFFHAQLDEVKREIYSLIDPYDPSGWDNASACTIVKVVQQWRKEKRGESKNE